MEHQLPVEDCAARLQKLHACLEKNHAHELKEQAAREAEEFRTTLLADKDAELAKAAAKAPENGNSGDAEGHC